MTGAILLSSWGCLTIFVRLPLRAIGVGFDRWWLIHTITGLAFEAALVTLTWVAFLVLRLAKFSRGPSNQSISTDILLTALLIGGSAEIEQLVSRRYVFQVIAKRNPPAAMFLCGLFLAGIHLPSEGGFAPIAMLNLFIVHVLFAMLYLRTRSLSLPVAVHAGWNFALGTVYGMSISRNDAPATIWVTVAKPGLWTGGAFGPEGALIITILLLVATTCIGRPVKQQNPSPDLLSPDGTTPSLRLPLVAATAPKQG